MKGKQSDRECKMLYDRVSWAPLLALQVLTGCYRMIGQRAVIGSRDLGFENKFIAVIPINVLLKTLWKRDAKSLFLVL